MSGYETLSLAAGATGTGLVLLSTISSTIIILATLLSPKKTNVLAKGARYEDADGVATEESTAAFSVTLPKTVICLLTVAGLGISIALAIIDTLNHDKYFIEAWLNAAAWIFLAIQAAIVAISKIPTETYDLGIHGAISSVFLFAALGIQNAILSLENAAAGSIGPIAPFALRVMQLALVVSTGFSHVLIPRRPQVFAENGMPVDAQFTTTALSRYTFAWSSQLLGLAIKQGTLELSDLPRPDHYSRAKSVTETWIQANRSGQLWKKLFLAHKLAFISQWMLTLMQSFGNVAPQFILLHLLRLLEKRDASGPGTSIAAEAWIWVLGLGITTIVASWIDAWLFWISIADISVPVRAELSALVFQKSMRRKDVKGATKKKKAATEPEDGVDAPTVNVQAGPGQSEATPISEQKNDEEETDENASKSTVNLIGMDAKRIADFCSFNNYFPGSLFKLVISFTFLVEIIGWKALGAGLISMLIVIPFNIFFAKRYAAAQGRLMEIRDQKEAKISEALKGIRQIKFSALEGRWQDSLNQIRGKELVTLWDVFISDTCLLFCWVSSPIILAATSLAVYSLSNRLSPSVAFTSIGIFNTLQVTLAVVPELTTDLLDAIISINRIQAYLESPEIDLKSAKDSPNIIFDNATFAWPSDEEKEDGDERFVLRNVNIDFPKGELSVISGKTGSGKSMLLAAILREVDIISGTLYIPKALKHWERHDNKATKENWIIPNSIAFVAQIPWIENATIKDNVLFGLPLDEERYKKTIEACALRKDLEMLPDGEKTEIGANGINLSGGQKWRLSFARALYSRAGILVLDDIFSAVDAHVGRHIFEKGLVGELGVGRTRILVTHHVALCKSKTKYLVELGEGTVLNAGLLSELEEDGTLTKIISHEQASKMVIEDEDITAVNSEESSDIGEIVEPLQKVDTRASARKFVEEEKKEKGAVKGKLYVEYLRSSGGVAFWGGAAIIFTSQQALKLGRQWWLTLWTGANQEESSLSAFLTMTTQRPVTTLRLHTSSDDNLFYYLSIYISISMAVSFIGTFVFFYIYTGSIRASRRLFQRLLFTVLRAPLRWHDTVPLGRTLNRFTADFNVIDSRLANDISFGLAAFLGLMGVMIAGIFVSPYVIILALALATICIQIARRYLTGARESKRLESIAKSPIFSQFGSALTGISTIRAFDKTDTYIRSMENLIDDHTATTWYLWLFNRWMGFGMTMVGSVFAAIVAGVVISLPSIKAALGGFCLTYALEYSGSFLWTVRHYTNLELDMNAAERIIEFSQLPTESIDGIDPPAAWPSEGRMEVHNLSVTYAPDLPYVLKDLTFSVERNQRIGVVGRTGAGKSSLTLAIFRFLEAQTGSIYIDGIDISKIKLSALRSRLAIIPQDPVLFSGTIRSNLDPFEDRTDAELQDALSRVHLVPSSDSGNITPVPGTSTPTSASEIASNKNIFKSLSSAISPSGLNLSQGQRQLLCLARAIVSRPKIMVLDEATSAVDMATDALIQRSIREEFEGSTLIVIAHRLSTIADFDKILVLGEGKVVEFGTPKELMEAGVEGDGKGVFREMVEQSGERTKLEAIIMGGSGGKE